ncbi:phospholipase D-like domain-containing protein [Roseovarius spongiae]|uniref:phospholipase D-like domain-containing protein n=1 Tax=Roseovarius spongiae TaxID=2320272 RepID=UPI00197DA7DC|nr:phospholipase D-like domain-containing protein [Roseovarius spongiae]
MLQANEAGRAPCYGGAEARPAAVLVPGRNCCALSEAERAALLIDGEAYFAALDASLRRAERSILIIGWDFDARIRLRPQDGADAPTLGDLLRSLVEERPDLHVRVLVWSLATAHGPGESLPLFVGADWSAHERISVRLDTHHPFYASHHQKMVIIDDSVAFVGGMDLTVARWDRPGHAPEEKLREDPDGKPYEPVHDVQAVLDGPVVRAVGDIARERWRDATNEALPAAAPVDRWPDSVEPDLSNVSVAVSRTRPRYNGRAGVEEVAQLTDDLLRAARRTVYIETQYFTSHRVGRLLETMLAQPDGPEIVVVCTRTANGVAERFIMGANRERLLRRLKAADRHDRLRVYYPVADSAEAHRLLIHAKVAFIDDRFLRVGSANLNNRSVGLDTECDVTLVAQTQPEREAIRRLRDTLLAEHLGVDRGDLNGPSSEGKRLLDVIDGLRHDGHSLRLMPTSRGARRPFPGTVLLDPERPLPLAGGLYRLWSRLARFGRARDRRSSESPSVASPKQRGTRK